MKPAFIAFVQPSEDATSLHHYDRITKLKYMANSRCFKVLKLNFTIKTRVRTVLKSPCIRSHNRGRRPQARAISSIGVGPIIWDNFSIFRTNCAIACGTRAYMLQGFLWMSRRGNGIRDLRNLLCFWPTTQHVYVC